MMSNDRAHRYALVSSFCLLIAACGSDDGGDGDSNAPVPPSDDTGTVERDAGDMEDAVADAGPDAQTTDASRPDTAPPDDTGGNDTSPQDAALDDATTDTRADGSEPDDARADAAPDTLSDTSPDTSPDGGPSNRTYRILAMSEAPKNQESFYFALRYGPNQPFTVLPANSPKTYTYGKGDIDVAKSSGRLFALNQQCASGSSSCSISSGRIREVSFKSNGALQTEQTLEFASGAYNPYDVGYVASTQRYYGLSYIDSAIQVFDQSGSRLSSPSYDTSQFDPNTASGDKEPEAAHVLVDGDYVLIVLQTLKGFSAENKSQLAVIDTSNQSWIDFNSSKSGTQTLKLPGKNAFAGFERTGTGNFAVGLTGSYQSTSDGKIAIVQRSRPGQYSIGSTVIGESDLGGNLSGFVMLDESSGYAAVLEGMDTKIKYFDTSGGSVNVQTLSGLNSPGGALCLSPDHRRLFVADESGYVAYDTQSQTKLTSQPVAPNNYATSRSCVVTMQ